MQPQANIEYNRKKAKTSQRRYYCPIACENIEKNAFIITALIIFTSPIQSQSIE